MKSLFSADEKETYTQSAEELNTEIREFAEKIFTKYAEFPVREVESIAWDAFYSAGIFARTFKRFGKEGESKKKEV